MNSTPYNATPQTNQTSGWNSVTDSYGLALQRTYTRTAESLGHQVADSGFILAK